MAGHKWECIHGCNQAAAIAATGRYCIHLERKIGPSGGVSDRYVVGLDDRMGGGGTPESLLIDKQEALSLGYESEDSPLVDDEEKFRLKLRKLTGLSERKINVLVARLVRGLTFQEISIELGYTSRAHAGQAYRDAIAILKKRSNQ